MFSQKAQKTTFRPSIYVPEPPKKFSTKRSFWKIQCSVIEIDATSIYDLGFPMGVFLLADYTGLDIAYSVFKAMSERGFKAYDCKTIESKYREGNLGVKTGKGIYNYPAPGKYERPKIPFDKLRREISIILLSPAVNEAAMFFKGEDRY